MRTNGKDPTDGTETERLSPGESSRHASLYGVLLLVHHDAGVEAVPLEPGAGLVVGREPPSDVIVRDPSLSRQHARFTLHDGEVMVEDLGSTNSTSVDGRKIDRYVVRLGDVVMLGAVAASVYALAGAWGSAPKPNDPGVDELVAVSAAMRPVLQMVGRVARSKVAVLLYGETGTGKEELSRLIHERGPRRDKPMIRINCGAIPAPLVGSILFGHERGAFTGAVQQQKGIFEAANGGTILLDEVGELDAAAQAALLRTLETQRVMRVGSTKEIEVDVRILAATHRDLKAMCDAGAFRRDLLYRLDVVTLEIPPLRARREDIAPLAQRFLHQANQTSERHFHGIDADALALLEAYAWPGNIRELRNCIERAVVIAEGETIAAHDLPQWLREAAGARSPPTWQAPAMELTSLSAAERKAWMDQFEKETILKTLRETGWNQTEAAKRLDMPLRTLQRRIKVLGIKRPL